MARQVLTRDDLAAVGACGSGVAAWVRRHAPGVTALPTDTVLRLVGAADREWVEKAAELIGDGSGSGSGYGSGDGYGSGSGDGSGDGYGDGDGYGSGDGDGYGSGDGYGDGGEA